MSERKEQFHRKGKTFLRNLARKLSLLPSSYEIRSCLGGPAVMGEVILHHNLFYVMVTDRPEIMWRPCEGRKDYVGKNNRWVKPERLLGDIESYLEQVK